MNIELSYYFENLNKSYKGRLLGLIDEKQFAYLNLNHTTTANKVKTCKSVKLSDIKKTDYKNMRIVMSMTCNKKGQGLFISRPIETIHNCFFKNKQLTDISFIDNDGNWFTLEKS